MVQGADWHYGPARATNITAYPPSGQPAYIKYSSLVTFILAIFFLGAYLVFQVRHSYSENDMNVKSKLQLGEHIVIKI